MIVGAMVGLVVMLVIWFGGGGSERRLADIIGGMLLNMAVFGAMLSYILQAVSFILLRRNQPQYRAAVPQAARHPRRGGHHRHRAW